MLKIQDLSNAIAEIAQGAIPVDVFERWLRRESRNVHASGNRELIDAVLALESVLSAYRFDGLVEQKVASELESAILPFEGREPFANVAVSVVEIDPNLEVSTSSVSFSYLDRSLPWVGRSSLFEAASCAFTRMEKERSAGDFDAIYFNSEVVQPHL